MTYNEPWTYPKYYDSFVAGTFDVIHPEYIKLFKLAKSISSYLTVALNVSPEGKRKPVLSADEREEMLYAIRYVDKVVRYNGEEELTTILEGMKERGRVVRVMGDDHKGKSTRPDLGIPTVYKPYGEWSATKLKRLYGESVK
jgi:glycerol-3-phosphate cytidylyltransferase-like family protein